MTFLVQATGSFAGAAPTAPSVPATQTGTYRVLAPTPAAAELVAAQLLIADQARAGLRLTGTVNTAAAG
jgi:hypothetical protein